MHSANQRAAVSGCRRCWAARGMSVGVAVGWSGVGPRTLSASCVCPARLPRALGAMSERGGPSVPAAPCARRDRERRGSECVARSQPRVLLPAGELRREAHLSQRSAKSQLPRDCHRSGSLPCGSVPPYSTICAFLQSLRTDQ